MSARNVILFVAVLLCVAWVLSLAVAQDNASSEDEPHEQPQDPRLAALEEEIAEYQEAVAYLQGDIERLDELRTATARSYDEAVATLEAQQEAYRAHLKETRADLKERFRDDLAELREEMQQTHKKQRREAQSHAERLTQLYDWFGLTEDVVTAFETYTPAERDILLALPPTERNDVLAFDDETRKRFFAMNDITRATFVALRDVARERFLELKPENRAQIVEGYAKGKPLVALSPVTLKDALSNPIHEIEFAPDGELFVTVERRFARLWRLKQAGTAKEVARLRGHSRYIEDVAFAPDGQSIVTASRDDTARIWTVEDDGNVEHRNTLKYNNEVTAVATLADGRIVTGDDEGNAYLWRINDAEHERTDLDVQHGGRIHSISTSQQGDFSISSQRTISRWRVDEDGEVNWRDTTDADEAINSAAISPDGEWMLTGQWEHVLRLWASSDEGWEPSYKVSDAGAPVSTDTAFLPCGLFALSLDNGFSVTLWRVTNGELQRTDAVSTPRRVRSMAVSPNGLTLLLAMEERRRVRRNVRSLEMVELYVFER